MVTVTAGFPTETLKGSQTAVFHASMLEDYARLTAMDPDNAERTAITGGTVSCVIPNRVSWYFDLRGPSVHVNTACSSSLVAVDMACKTLRSGDASCVSQIKIQPSPIPVHAQPPLQWNVRKKVPRRNFLKKGKTAKSYFLCIDRPLLPEPTCCWTLPFSICCRARTSCHRIVAATALTTAQGDMPGVKASLPSCLSQSPRPSEMVT